MPSPKTRKERLEYILNITKKHKKVNTRWLFGEMSLKFGVSKRTFLEYIRALVDAGKIYYNEDEEVITLEEG